MNEFITTDASAIYAEIITSLESSVGEPLYPGDERRIFGEALVALVVSLFNSMNDAAKQKMLRYARGSVLDALGERAGVQRIGESPASTTLRFSIEAPLEENVIIPQGTRVTNDSTHYFATVGAAVITAGETSVEVEARSVGGGTEFNGFEPGTITTIVDPVLYVDEVTNTTITTGGDDVESDDSFRERIKAAPSMLSTAGPVNSYKYWAMSADSSIADVVVKSETEVITRELDVTAQKAYKGGSQLQPDTLVVYKADGAEAAKETDYTATFEDELLTITITPGGALKDAAKIKISIETANEGVVKIIPICDGGQIPDQTILQKVYDACNADEVRPLTDMVKVEAPTVETYDIELTYYTTAADESGCIQTVESAGGAIDKFNDWQCAELGRSINPDKLRALILAPTEEGAVAATRVEITKPTFREISDTSIARFSGTKTIKHEVTAR